MHGGGKGIVGALRFVDVVVGVNRFFAPHHAAGNFDSPVADHLVDVHVGLGARAGLPNDQREMVVQLSRDNFVSDLSDQIASFLI